MEEKEREYCEAVPGSGEKIKLTKEEYIKFKNAKSNLSDKQKQRNQATLNKIKNCIKNNNEDEFVR